MRRKSDVSDLRIGPFAPMADYVHMFFEMVGACRNAGAHFGCSGTKAKWRNPVPVLALRKDDSIRKAEYPFRPLANNPALILRDLSNKISYPNSKCDSRLWVMAAELWRPSNIVRKRWLAASSRGDLTDGDSGRNLINFSDDDASGR